MADLHPTATGHDHDAHTHGTAEGHLAHPPRKADPKEVLVGLLVTAAVIGVILFF
jgi:hypothetical protein